MMKRHIPNAITLLNLTAGIIGIIYAAAGDLITASFMIIAAAVFDLLDGLAARMLGVTSPIGKELDSLADMVSFSVLPAIILFYLFRDATWLRWGPVLLIPILAALRLAKFNIDTKQAKVFRGLPTPAAAFLLGTWPLGIHFGSGIPNGLIIYLTSEPIIGALVAMILAFLMVIPVQIFSFKIDKNKGLQSTPVNWARLIVVIASVLMLVFFQLASLMPIILFYVLVSACVNRQLKEEV